MATSATNVSLHSILPGHARWLEGGWIEVCIPKGTLILTLEELKVCLQRGKWWSRHKTLQARLQAAEDRR